MDGRKDFLAGAMARLRKMDRAQLADEMRMLGSFINRQLFRQIPSVSALAGILAGSWVSSTFTTSPLRGFLASWGLVKGGTRVVSSATYRFLSVLMPLLAMAVTAYLVQKALKGYRARRLAKDRRRVSRMPEEVRSEVRGKMDILDAARENGLISEAEYETKQAMLFQSYSRKPPSRVRDFLIGKMS